jgi:hypothetical protein
VQHGQARPGLNDEEWRQSGTFGAHAKSGWPLKPA